MAIFLRIATAIVISVSLMLVSATENSLTLLCVNFFGFVGALLNTIVILANDLKMPVLFAPGDTADGINPAQMPAGPDTRYPWLIDRFAFYGFYFSIGDILIIASLLVTLFLSPFV